MPTLQLPPASRISTPCKAAELFAARSDMLAEKKIKGKAPEHSIDASEEKVAADAKVTDSPSVAAGNRRKNWVSVTTNRVVHRACTS